MEKFVAIHATEYPDIGVDDSRRGQPIVTVNEKRDQIRVSYVFPGFTLSDDAHEVEDETMSFLEIGIPGVGFISRSGAPLLPSFGRFVQLPPDCTFEVKVVRGKPEIFEDILVSPAQEQLLDGKRSDSDDNIVEFDKDSYNIDALYPEMVAIGNVQEMDGYRVLPVHIRPILYNSAQKTLTAYREISLVIDLHPFDGIEREYFDAFSALDQANHKDGFGNFLINPKRRINERLALIGTTPANYSLPILPKGEEFHIIYAPDLEDAAIRLAQWKNQKGISTSICSITKIGNDISLLKQYIRNRRGFSGSRLRYLLFLGDVDTIVTEEIPGAPPKTTDYYYFTKKDPVSSVDCQLPWLAGGRIPVTDPDDANSIIGQIMAYEKKPPMEDGFYRKMTFAAPFQGNNENAGKDSRAYVKTMECIRNHLLSLDLGYEVAAVYSSFDQSPPENREPSVELVDKLKESQSIIAHRGHGSVKGWVGPNLEAKDLQNEEVNLGNSVFFSLNCFTGKFDAKNQDSFAEDLLKLGSGGVPSIIAATEFSGTWRNNSLMKALFDAIWPGVLPTFGEAAGYALRYNRLGDVLNYAKSYLLDAHDVDEGVKSHNEIYHVLGDPTLQLWTALPLNVSLRVTQDERNLYILLDTCPVYATLTILYEDEVVRRINPTSVRVFVPFVELLQASSQKATQSEIPEQTFSVCFSAPGYRFVQTSLSDSNEESEKEQRTKQLPPTTQMAM